MNIEKSIDIMINRACPSIQYRIKREIFNESPNSTEMVKLQVQILGDKKVKEIMSLQKEDGWLGGDFHSENEPEGGIRLLREKGVDGNNDVIIKALNALLPFDNALGRIGKILDECHIGGAEMIKSCVFAYAAHENYNFIQAQIQEALLAFEYVTQIEDVCETFNLHKDKLCVFKNNSKWPSIYHLRLLAFTESWRNVKNKNTLVTAFTKLAEFSPIPPIKLLYKSQIVSPASIYMNDFNTDLSNISAKEWMMWFHRVELIARLGIANDVPQIRRQIDVLQDYLNSNQGFFIKPLSHYYFTKWDKYLGLALENDWKVKDARINDLTFRSLLILKLANRL